MKFRVGQRVRRILPDSTWHNPPPKSPQLGAFGVVVGEQTEPGRWGHGTDVDYGAPWGVVPTYTVCLELVEDDDGTVDWRDVEQMLPWKREVTA